MTSQTQFSGDAPGTSSIALRVVSRRRRRVARTGMFIVVITAFMILIAVANRDEQNRQHCRKRLEYAVGVFESCLPASLPAAFPQRQSEDDGPSAHFDYRSRNPAAADAGESVGVACCLRPHKLFLDEDGRYVLIFSGEGKFEIRWMSESEFQARADELRLTPARDSGVP